MFHIAESGSRKYRNFYYELVTSDFRVPRNGKRKLGMDFPDDLKKMDPRFLHCGKQILLSEIFMLMLMLHLVVERLNTFTLSMFVCTCLGQ